ncbi:hypothetical protein ACOSP7_027384 [Xanthoceras sorbifolium]
MFSKSVVNCAGENGYVSSNVVVEENLVVVSQQIVAEVEAYMMQGIELDLPFEAVGLKFGPNLVQGVMNGNSGPLMKVQEAKGLTKTNRKWKRAARAGPGAKNLGPGEHSPIQKMLIATQVIRCRRRSGSKSPSAWIVKSTKAYVDNEMPKFLVFAVTLWYIWMWRCSAVFDDGFVCPSWPIMAIKDFLWTGYKLILLIPENRRLLEPI